MKKSKKILILFIIIFLIGIYFGYKGFNLLYYDVNNMSIEDYNKIVDGLKVNGAITVKSQKLNNDEEYLTYKNIKIRNDFKDFEYRDDLNESNVSATYVLKDEDKNKNIAIIIGSETQTYVDMIKADTTLFGTNDKRISNTELEKYLDKNNITNDIELFEFISNQKGAKNNIFTSVKQMKENYKLHFITVTIFPVLKNVTAINGDYNGYLFNTLTTDVKEVNIIKNNKRYTIGFLGSDYFTDDYISELLTTIVIE